MSAQDDRTTATFLRGLTIGAIIGAIVAGSSIWARWRGARRPQRPPPATTARQDQSLIHN
jgi:hypothetical protein